MKIRNETCLLKYWKKNSDHFTIQKYAIEDSQVT